MGIEINLKYKEGRWVGIALRHTQREEEKGDFITLAICVLEN